MQSTARIVCAAALSVVCGLVVCLIPGRTAASASLASRSSVEAAKAAPSRFCAYEIRTPTAAEIAAINRYWTPLARSAVRLVSRGKMLVETPKRHLSPAQRQALRRAEWAWRAFAPKPRLVCLRLPAGQGARRARPPVTYLPPGRAMKRPADSFPGCRPARSRVPACSFRGAGVLLGDESGLGAHLTAPKPLSSL